MLDNGPPPSDNNYSETPRLQRRRPPMIRFRCPTCKFVLESPGTMAGRKIVCPHCGQRLLIPNPVKPAEGSNTILGEPLPVSPDSLTGSKLDWLDDLRTVESYPAPGAVRVDGEMAAETSACREKTLHLAGLLL